MGPFVLVDSTAVIHMDKHTFASNMDKVEMAVCEATESGGYVELSLGLSLRLHVTVAEDTVSVVVTEPGERQASIVVEDTDWWQTKTST